MTTTELALRALRHCKPSSLGSLKIEQGLEITDAISYALGEFFTYAPSNKKRTTASVDLCAPFDVKINIKDCSHEFTGHTFDERYIGCTIDLGDNCRNEIRSATTLLDAYKGTSGEVTAKVYHDAVSMTDNRTVQKICNDPVLFKCGHPIRQLCRVQRDYAPKEGFFNWSGWGEGNTYYTWYTQWEHGDPTHYAIIETGISQNADDWWILKIHPSPKDAITLRFDVEIDPQMICWDNLSNFPVSLPVSDREFHQILLPMVENELMASTLWDAEPNTNQMISDRYGRARQALKMIEIDRAPNQNHLGTPHGW